MVDQDRTGTERAHGKVLKAVPVTPSEETERAQGLAFDVEKGADLPGVPVGDQVRKNPGADHTEQVVRETGGGVGLAVPGDPDRNVEVPIDDEASQR
jgi:hypothetical protein